MTLTRLESHLLFNVLETAPQTDRWATACRASLYSNLRDKVYRRRCLGAVFRRVAARDPAWFMEMCRTAGPADPPAIRRQRLTEDELMSAAGWLTPAAGTDGKPIVLRVAALNVTLGPGDRGWRRWIQDVREAESLPAASSLADVERCGAGTAAVPLPPPGAGVGRGARDAGGVA